MEGKRRDEGILHENLGLQYCFEGPLKNLSLVVHLRCF